MVDKVSSDLNGISSSRFLLGQRFVNGEQAPSQQLTLRFRFGGITIKSLFPEYELKRAFEEALEKLVGTFPGHNFQGVDDLLVAGP
jgi:hypothetical protein